MNAVLCLQVVAESMNNYLMFDKILKVKPVYFLFSHVFDLFSLSYSNLHCFNCFNAQVELVLGEKKSRAIFMGKINPTKPPLLQSRFPRFINSKGKKNHVPYFTESRKFSELLMHI